MNTELALAIGFASRGKERMVFDWDTAAKLIRENSPRIALAGLRYDWEYTGGEIYIDGEPIFDSYTYLASTWATPELNLDGKVVPCYKMQHEVPDWGDATKWPQSAIDILKG